MEKLRADEIITEFLQKIYGFAVKKSYSYDEAEELAAWIVEEVYGSLLRAAEIFNVEGYIWRIAEHTFSKYVSTKKKHEGVSLDSVQVPFYEDGYPEDSDETVSRLRKEIAFLTKTRRQIVYRFYYENQSVFAISKETGVSVGTVKWHLNRARKELKEVFSMERIIGKLGLAPIEAVSIGHGGNPGANGGPEFYLQEKLNLNIVYSVYRTPKTKEEIAEELGLTPVYLEDKIDYLEGNGFLVRTAKNRFTTYVQFEPEKYSLELRENKLKTHLEIAEMLAEEYVPRIREAIRDTKAYIPGKNKELLEAAAIFYGIANKCQEPVKVDLSKYMIRTTDGGTYLAFVSLPAVQSDPEYQPTLFLPSYQACGPMTRSSKKYPSVSSWSVDTRYSTREGAWENNCSTDYEFLYEQISGAISDNAANAEKFQRLRDRKFLTKDGKVNIMVVGQSAEDFFAKIPEPEEKLKKQFADKALEFAMMEAKAYPPQMQDLVVGLGASCFIDCKTALMVMDILYGNGTFRPLTENEKFTSNLLMFSDLLPDV